MEKAFFAILFEASVKKYEPFRCKRIKRLRRRTTFKQDPQISKSKYSGIRKKRNHKKIQQRSFYKKFVVSLGQRMPF
jgi:hypothetical protein